MKVTIASDALRAARRSVGWSQEQLAAAAGLRQSHVARIEAGNDARFLTIQSAFAAMGYSIEFRPPKIEALFSNPPAGSRAAAARDFGVDLGQLLAGFVMSPAERLERAAASATAFGTFVSRPKR
jgi:transcriptional regulator with XRE-family HTH domain